MSAIVGTAHDAGRADGLGPGRRQTAQPRSRIRRASRQTHRLRRVGRTGRYDQALKLYPTTAIALAVLLIGPRCALSQPIFKDVAEQVGLRFHHYNGMTGKYYLPEITGSGAALFDFDNDGDLDVFLVQGNVLEPGTQPSSTQFPWRGPELPRSRLFRNDLVVGKDSSRTL